TRGHTFDIFGLRTTTEYDLYLLTEEAPTTGGRDIGTGCPGALHRRCARRTSKRSERLRRAPRDDLPPALVGLARELAERYDVGTAREVLDLVPVAVVRVTPRDVAARQNQTRRGHRPRETIPHP